MNSMTTTLKDISDLLLKDDELKDIYEEQRANVKFALMLKAWRNKAGISQIELAKRLNTKQSVISRWESVENESLPNLNKIVELAHACGNSFLMGGTPLERKEPYVSNTDFDTNEEYLVAI